MHEPVVVAGTHLIVVIRTSFVEGEMNLSVTVTLCRAVAPVLVTTNL